MKAITRNRLLLLSTAAVVLVLDQLSKRWVTQNLPAYTPTHWIPWLEPIVSFTYVTNTGIAFGLFPQLGGIFAILSALVIALIFVFQSSLTEVGIWVHLALGSVTGGAIGNLLDRVLRGSVVDFLDLNFWPMRTWAIFNIADSAVVVGVIVLLIDSILFDTEAQQQQPHPAPEDALTPEDSHANI